MDTTKVNAGAPMTMYVTATWEHSTFALEQVKQNRSLIKQCYISSTILYWHVILGHSIFHDMHNTPLDVQTIAFDLLVSVKNIDKKFIHDSAIMRSVAEQPPSQVESLNFHV